MNPLDLLKSLGISLADLASAARFDAPLRKLGAESGSFIQFAYQLRQTPIAGLTLPVRIAYNVANYLAHQAQYLGMLGPTGEIPYQMAQVIRRSPREQLGEAWYRYNVAVEIRLPDQNIRQTYYVTLDAQTPRDTGELYREALEYLIRQKGFRNYADMYVDEFDYYEPEFHMAGFYRLTPRT